MNMANFRRLVIITRHDTRPKHLIKNGLNNAYNTFVQMQEHQVPFAMWNTINEDIVNMVVTWTRNLQVDVQTTHLTHTYTHKYTHAYMHTCIYK